MQIPAGMPSSGKTMAGIKLAGNLVENWLESYFRIRATFWNRSPVERMISCNW